MLAGINDSLVINDKNRGCIMDAYWIENEPDLRFLQLYLLSSKKNPRIENILLNSIRRTS